MSAPDEHTGIGEAVVDYYRETPRRHALMHSMLDPDSLVQGGVVSLVDQMLVRISTLMDFAALVEVEVITVDDDLVNTPFDCWASCDGAPPKGGE